MGNTTSGCSWVWGVVWWVKIPIGSCRRARAKAPEFSDFWILIFGQAGQSESARAGNKFWFAYKKSADSSQTNYKSLLNKLWGSAEKMRQKRNSTVKQEDNSIIPAFLDKTYKILEVISPLDDIKDSRKMSIKIL